MRGRGGGVVVAATVLSAVVALAQGQPSLLARHAQEPRFSGPSSQTLHQLLNDYWEWRLATEPELATSVGRHEHDGRWSDRSRLARDRARDARREYLSQAMILTPGTLNPADYLSSLLWEHELRDGLDSEEHLDFISTLSQRGGAHTRVFTTIEAMPAASLVDYENHLNRLRALPRYVDETIRLLDEQLAQGLARPTVVVDIVLAELDAQRRTPALESPLLAAFQAFPESMPAAAQRRLRQAAVRAFEQSFAPSWSRYADYLRSTYRPRSRAEVGLGALPGGSAMYGQLVRHFTTTGTPPSEIHDTGLREVARIEGEMRAVAADYGAAGSLADFERELAARPGMRFESEDEMLAYAESVVASVRPQLGRLFARVPRTDVHVRPIPPDRAATTASNYSSGTADGRRPGYVNLNTYRPTEQVRYPLEAVLLHEAVPGHHLQRGLQRELEGLPSFRAAFTATAFVEGWALYAESVGAELGVYRDPPTRFGRLVAELFRAVRLVVDTGLHARGWSRDEARRYFAEHLPSQSLAEVDRYIAQPGQALAYKIGERHLTELRRRAEAALGERFDIRAFHDAVLRNGAMPLDLLDEEVARYISRGGQ